MRQNGSLFSNTVLLGVSAVFSKAVAFLLMPFYTAALSPAAFGTVDLVVSTAVLLLPFVSLNAPAAVFRFLAGEGEEAKKSILSNAVLLLGIGFLLFLLLLPLVRFSAVLTQYWRYLLFYVSASLLRSFLAHLLRAEGAYAVHALQQFLCAALTAALQIFLIVGVGLDIKGYLLGVALADGAVALGLAWYLRPWRFLSRRALCPARLASMLRYALPLIPTSVFWWITAISDRYIILYYGGLTQTGLYAAAARIPTLLTFTVGIFMEAWQYAALEGEGEARTAHFGRIYRMLLPVAFLTASLLLVLAYPAVNLVFAAEYRAAVHFLPFLILAALFSALSGFFGSVYTVNLQSGASFLSALLGALLNLLLNFLWIPRLGALGAAVATFVAYLTVFLVRAAHTVRALPFERYMGKTAVALAFLLIAAFLISAQKYLLAVLPAAAALLPFLREMWETARFFYKRMRFLLKKRQKNTN
ncbi:MAG: oligosaccharide flippase family protein [Clostridia bacterium]|nr:oligosaccharide flippase family protein [Clostridia bacterium]